MIERGARDQQEQPLNVLGKPGRHGGGAGPFGRFFRTGADTCARDGEAAAKRREVERLARQPMDAAADEEILIEHGDRAVGGVGRSEEHTSEIQSLMRSSSAGFCLKKKKTNIENH